ncbi:aminotransferase class I/II-fold pyridoxal phosphate-dependent enzyme [Leptospirillum ferrooxidans]|uniref:Putative L-threonine-O-3-phosphate decarboxylase n=1 Tax=Leptospirillum ferrooxidans (strain C2-3) TaxID=1162668 RepID=I0IN42_LEPFC|nr:aminotransferase class I/II-fold pyridoxal phosphate-dependent enzyme [Leptospirillum ferrooxidans]BAM06691.1 putative L-threonine-O-3-phosphate decarboxylase [Leptospirillum ferrooxidans C2-3]
MDHLIKWDHGGGPAGSCELDTSTTINPLGPPFSMDLLWKKLSGEMAFYPDPYSGKVQSELASCYSLPHENVLPGSGATALLYRLFETLNPLRLILPEPIFSEYPRAGEAFGIPMVFVSSETRSSRFPWQVDPGFSGVIENARRGDLVVLVNPVNPTGEEFSRDSLMALGNHLFLKGAFLLIDESFQDFIAGRSSVLAFKDEFLSSFYVLKSFTKISGLAGIRTGALFGPAEILSLVRRRLGPWSLGLLEQEVISRLVSNREGSLDQCAVLSGLLEILAQSLLNEKIPVSRGAGPFLLARTGWGARAGELADRSLGDFGVRLRVASGFGPSNGGDWIRIGFQGLTHPERVVDTILRLS